MSASEIVRKFNQLGIRLFLGRDGNLRARPLPPRDALSDELRELLRFLRKREREVVQLLSERPEMSSTSQDVGSAEMSSTPEMPKSGVVEATFRPTVELVYPQPGPAIRPTKPEFPRCPECDVARYWIAPTGKVICGSCGKVRLIITAVEYHAIQ
jgi:hypothetical protein